MTTKGEHIQGETIAVFTIESYDGYKLEVVRGDKPFESDHYYGLLTLTDTRRNVVLLDKVEVGLSFADIYGPDGHSFEWYNIAEDKIEEYEAEHPDRVDPWRSAFVTLDGKKDIRSGEDVGANHADDQAG
jgi:hypothetical protein